MMAGDLDRRVTLMRAINAPDSFGELVGTVADVATVAAAKLDLTAKDVQRAQLHSTPVEAKFVIRWRADVKIDDRLRLDGAVFEIVGIREIGRRRWLELTVRAG